MKARYYVARKRHKNQFGSDFLYFKVSKRTIISVRKGFSTRVGCSVEDFFAVCSGIIRKAKEAEVALL